MKTPKFTKKNLSNLHNIVFMYGIQNPEDKLKPSLGDIQLPVVDIKDDPQTSTQICSSRSVSASTAAQGFINWLLSYKGEDHSDFFNPVFLEDVKAKLTEIIQKELNAQLQVEIILKNKK